MALVQLLVDPLRRFRNHAGYCERISEKVPSEPPARQTLYCAAAGTGAYHQQIIDHSEPGTVESVLNFCHYCLNDEKLTDYLDYFESKNIGIINASPLSMGLLSQRGVPAWHPAPQSLVEACRKAVQHCLSKNYPIEKLAIQYSVSNPRIATTLFSSANPDNVLKNITYAEEPIDWNLVKEVQEIIGEQMRVSWANS